MIDDSYTKVLLHMDGADASTTFTDESGKSWTATNQAQIDTAQSKFGGASGLFDGTTDYIGTSNNADFDFGSGDFTIDFWVRRNGNQSNYAGLIAGSEKSTLTGWCVVWSSSSETINKILFASKASGSWAINLQSTGTISDATWTHVAIVRYGNTLKLYFDGTQTGSTFNCTGLSFNSSGNGCKIAANYVPDPDAYHNGWIDEVRISKGIARWTANFTPPTAAYGLPRVKTVNGIAASSIKTINGIAASNIKTINGIPFPL